MKSEIRASVVSSPQRGPWGNPKYRGNCDGKIIKNLLLQYRPARVGDPMMGGGTCRDVVTWLNERQDSSIAFWGADLKSGFDATSDSLPREFDFIWLHPPYFNIIRYSDDHRDLSVQSDYCDFRLMLEQCLTNCFRALIPGGRLAVLVGDVRKAGRYRPIVRDVMNLEGRIGRIRSVLIKTQHNCMSDNRRYRQMEDVRIAHEYCVVFKKE